MRKTPISIRSKIEAIQTESNIHQQRHEIGPAKLYAKTIELRRCGELRRIIWGKNDCSPSNPPNGMVTSFYGAPFSRSRIEVRLFASARPSEVFGMVGTVIIIPPHEGSSWWVLWRLRAHIFQFLVCVCKHCLLLLFAGQQFVILRNVCCFSFFFRSTRLIRK